MELSIRIRDIRWSWQSGSETLEEDNIRIRDSTWNRQSGSETVHGAGNKYQKQYMELAIRIRDSTWS